MARTLSITTPAEKTRQLITDLKNIDGILEIQLFESVSIEPPGDVIKLTTANSDLNKIMRLLDTYDLSKNGGVSLSTSEPDSFIPTTSALPLQRDKNEGTWEEMEMTISNDSNTSINTLIIMFISGVLATIGVVTNQLHIVIGGMLIAPGFMPITRIALGLASKHRAWYYGSFDFFKGYLVLIFGAILTSIGLQVMDINLITSSSSYYIVEKDLLDYWTSISKTSLLASAAASIAGALLIATKKSVFTSGVMIGLALVPTAAIIGIGIVVGDFTMAGKALQRFFIDVGLVLGLSFLAFLWCRLIHHSRDMRL